MIGATKFLFLLFWFISEFLVFLVSECRHYFNIARTTALFIFIFSFWVPLFFFSTIQVFIVLQIVLFFLYRLWNKVEAKGLQGMAGKICIVTGVSPNGIGYYIVQKLLSLGATVIIGTRNYEKGRYVANLLAKETKNPFIDVLEVDVSSLNSIHNFSKEFKKKYQKLDVLVNNAGNSDPGISKDGFENVFATNYLGVFALTMDLLDLLEKSEGRIIHTSSTASELAKDIHINDIRGEKINGGYYSYSRSKLCLNMFSYELQKELDKKNSNVISTTFHPGGCYTEIWKKSLPFWLFIFVDNYMWFRLRSALEGAQTGIFLSAISSQEVKQYKGKYLYNNKLKNENPLVFDDDLRKELWKKSMELYQESLANKK